MQVSPSTVMRALREENLLQAADYQRQRRRTWRTAGCWDYRGKYESTWQVSPTANRFDAIEAFELALADCENLFGHPPSEECAIDHATGELLTAVTLVTDKSGSF